jgi:Cu/Ag efflux pump CusA
MNLSELCIRRPVMVVLLSATLILAGVLAYFYIPVAALPSYNTPVINVSADLPALRRKPWPRRWRCRWRSSSPPSPVCR